MVADGTAPVAAAAGAPAGPSAAVEYEAGMALAAAAQEASIDERWRSALDMAPVPGYIRATEGVRWKGYPSKLLHAAAFRVAKTP